MMTRRALAVSVLVLSTLGSVAPVAADNGFPFGAEMTLDAAPMRGSKRIPNLEIGDRGEVVLELWCKGGKGQFSVAGDTIVFVAGAMEERSCPSERAEADDALLAAMTAATNWRRQGGTISFIGPQTLRFRINTN